METIQPEVTKCQGAGCLNVFLTGEIREEKDVLALLELESVKVSFFNRKSIESVYLFDFGE